MTVNGYSLGIPGEELIEVFTHGSNGLGPKDHFITPLADQNLFPFKAKLLGQPDRLTAAMLEELGNFHSYTMYL